MRPKSIVHYEQIYIASIVIGLLFAIVQWPMMRAQFAATPLPPGAVMGIVAVSFLVGLGINILLLWLTARKGNDVARIIVTIFFGIGILSAGWAILRGTAPGLAGVVRVVDAVLEAIMLYLLFVPAESKAWFARRAGVA